MSLRGNTVPLSTELISGGDRVLVVLEINAGTADRFGIRIGTEIRHPAVDDSVAVWPCRQQWLTLSNSARFCYPFRCRGVAQSGSATALGAVGRWFESNRPDQCAARVSGSGMACPTVYVSL